MTDEVTEATHPSEPGSDSEPIEDSRVEYVMLCDSAQTTQDGKLYVLGGGWSHIARRVPPPGSDLAPPPTQFAIAASFLIDWNDADRSILIRITIEPDDEERPPVYDVQAQIGAGRPPQATPGEPLRVLIALPILIHFPQGGAYWVRAQMEGAREDALVRFQVSDVQMMLPAASG